MLGLFKKNFKIVEISNGGTVCVKHYCHYTKKQIEEVKEAAQHVGWEVEEFEDGIVIVRN